VVDQKIYLGIFALLRDLETRWGIVAGYFCEREEVSLSLRGSVATAAIPSNTEEYGIASLRSQ
jgi:hypothetical protein